MCCCKVVLHAPRHAPVGAAPTTHSPPYPSAHRMKHHAGGTCVHALGSDGLKDLKRRHGALDLPDGEITPLAERACRVPARTHTHTHMPDPTW